MKSSRHVLTLRRALEVAGDEVHLAKLLNTSPDVLSKWLAGEIPPPTKAYLAAIALVARHASPRRQQ